MAYPHLLTPFVIPRLSLCGAPPGLVFNQPSIPSRPPSDQEARVLALWGVVLTRLSARPVAANSAVAPPAPTAMPRQQLLA